MILELTKYNSSMEAIGVINISGEFILKENILGAFNSIINPFINNRLNTMRLRFKADAETTDNILINNRSTAFYKAVLFDRNGEVVNAGIVRNREKGIVYDYKQNLFTINIEDILEFLKEIPAGFPQVKLRDLKTIIYKTSPFQIAVDNVDVDYDLLAVPYANFGSINGSLPSQGLGYSYGNNYSFLNALFGTIEVAEDDVRESYSIYDGSLLKDIVKSIPLAIKPSLINKIIYSGNIPSFIMDSGHASNGELNMFTDSSPQEDYQDIPDEMIRDYRAEFLDDNIDLSEMKYQIETSAGINSVVNDSIESDCLLKNINYYSDFIRLDNILSIDNKDIDNSFTFDKSDLEEELVVSGSEYAENIEFVEVDIAKLAREYDKNLEIGSYMGARYTSRLSPSVYGINNTTTSFSYFNDGYNSLRTLRDTFIKNMNNNIRLDVGLSPFFYKEMTDRNGNKYYKTYIIGRTDDKIKIFKLENYKSIVEVASVPMSFSLSMLDETRTQTEVGRNDTISLSVGGALTGAKIGGAVGVAVGSIVGAGIGLFTSTEDKYTSSNVGKSIGIDYDPNLDEIVFGFCDAGYLNKNNKPYNTTNNTITAGYIKTDEAGNVYLTHSEPYLNSVIASGNMLQDNLSSQSVVKLGNALGIYIGVAKGKKKDEGLGGGALPNRDYSACVVFLDCETDTMYEACGGYSGSAEKVDDIYRGSSYIAYIDRYLTNKNTDEYEDSKCSITNTALLSTFKLMKKIRFSPEDTVVPGRIQSFITPSFANAKTNERDSLYLDNFVFEATDVFYDNRTIKLNLDYSDGLEEAKNISSSSYTLHHIDDPVRGDHFYSGYKRHKFKKQSDTWVLPVDRTKNSISNYGTISYGDKDDIVSISKLLPSFYLSSRSQFSRSVFVDFSNSTHTAAYWDYYRGFNSIFVFTDIKKIKIPVFKDDYNTTLKMNDSMSEWSFSSTSFKYVDKNMSQVIKDMCKKSGSNLSVEYVNGRFNFKFIPVSINSLSSNIVQSESTTNSISLTKKEIKDMNSYSVHLGSLVNTESISEGRNLLFADSIQRYILNRNKGTSEDSGYLLLNNKYDRYISIIDITLDYAYIYNERALDIGSYIKTNASISIDEIGFNGVVLDYAINGENITITAISLEE